MPEIAVNKAFLAATGSLFVLAGKKRFLYLWTSYTSKDMAGKTLFLFKMY
jgi:hypothetical protein